MARQAKVHWNKRRKRWYANIGEPDAKGRAREVFAPDTIGPRDEAAAWEWLRDEKARRAVRSVPVVRDVTVDMLCEHYLAWVEKEWAAGKITRHAYANRARHLGLLSLALGPRIVSALEPDDVTDFGRDLTGVYAPTYARNVLSTVRSAFGWAVRPGKLIAASPIKGFKLPMVPRSPARFAERAEAAAFVAFWRGRHPRDGRRGRFDRLTLLLERCLIRTGARPKELCQLQWNDIQWSGWRTASGHAAAKAVIPYDRWKAGKKTGKPRTIYFTPALTRALRRVRDAAFEPQWVFVHLPGRGGAGASAPWPHGSSLSHVVRKVRAELIAWQDETRAAAKRGEAVPPWALRRAAVDVKDDGDNRLVNYRWRHTAISTLLMLGVDVSTVAELTGTSPTMIYHHYGHLLDSHLQSAAEKLVGRQSKPGLRAPQA